MLLIFMALKLHLQLKISLLVKYKYLAVLAYCMTMRLCYLQPGLVVVLLVWELEILAAR